MRVGSTQGREKPSKVVRTSNVSGWPLREQLRLGIKQSRQINTVVAPPPFTLKAWDEVGERTPAPPAPLPAPKASEEALDVRLRVTAFGGFNCGGFGVQVGLRRTCRATSDGLSAPRTVIDFVYPPAEIFVQHR